MFKNKFLSILSSTIVFSTLSNFCCEAKDYILCLRSQQIQCTDCHHVIPNLPKYNEVVNMAMVCYPSDNLQRCLCEGCVENDRTSFVKVYVSGRIPIFDADAIRNLINDPDFRNIFPKVIFKGKEGAELKCAICFENVDVHAPHATCQNGHLYHNENCAENLTGYDVNPLMSTAKCPQCKTFDVQYMDYNSPALADSYNQSMRRVLNNIANAGHY